MIRKEGDWVEYFDKETGQLWYYNMINVRFSFFFLVLLVCLDEQCVGAA